MRSVTSLLLMLIMIVAAILFPAGSAVPPFAMAQLTTVSTVAAATTAPRLDVPNDMVFQRKASSSPGAPLLYSVEANDDIDGKALLDVWGVLTQDNVGGNIAISCNPSSGRIGLELGEHTVQCSAVDAAGNEGTASFKVSIVLLSPTTPIDSIAPSLSVPVDRTISTTSRTGSELVLYDVSATDNVDGNARLDANNKLTQEDNVGGSVGIVCSPPSGRAFPVGNNTLQCYAIDSAGNMGTASFKVSVVNPADTTTTPPPGGLSSGTITASLSASPTTYNGSCPATITFSGTITNYIGNRDVTYRFIFSDGSTQDMPVIHFDQPGSQTVSTSWTLTQPSFQGWAAIEILQPVQLQSNRAEFSMTCTTPATGAALPAGTDTIAPSLSVPVDTRIIRTTSPTGSELVLYDVSATDNVDGNARLDANNALTQEDNVGGSIAISCNPPSNTILPVGNYTVQCNATDAAGNLGTASFIVAVVSSSTATTTPLAANTLQAENTTTVEETAATTTADDEEGAGAGGAGVTGGTSDDAGTTTQDDAGAGIGGTGGGGGDDDNDDDASDDTDDAESPGATTNEQGAGGTGGGGGDDDNDDDNDDGSGGGGGGGAGGTNEAEPQ